MSKRKLLVIAALILSLVLPAYLLVSNGIARAQSCTPQACEAENEQVTANEQFEKLFGRLEKLELTIKEKAPVSAVISPDKKVTFINVNLETIEGTNLTIKIFGLVFKIDASEAKIYGEGKQATTSDLKIGDKLLIKGTIDETTGTIKATRIHDRSLHKIAIEKLKARIEELLKLIEELRAKVKALEGG